MKRRFSVSMIICAALFLWGCSFGAGKPEQTSAPASQAAPAETPAAAQTQAGSQAAAQGQGTATAQESTAAAQGTAAPETIASVPEAMKLEPIAFEVREYERRYPGVYEGEVEKLVARCEYPVLTEPENKYKALRDQLENIRVSFYDRVDYVFRDQASQFATVEPSEWELSAYPFSDIGMLSVTRADSRFFSMVNSNDSWYGGAHPYNYAYGYTIDAQTGNLLKLSDLAEDPDELYEAILQKVQQDENFDYFFDDWEETLEKSYYYKEDYSIVWYLDTYGLNVIFNAYALGPYAMGPVYMDFSYDSLKGLFKEEYLDQEVPGIEAPPSVYQYTVGVFEDLKEKSDESSAFYYDYTLPYIEGESAYAEEVSEALRELKANILEPQLEAVKAGKEPEYTECSYMVRAYDGITSLVVSLYDMNTYSSMNRVWNFNRKGEQAENAEIFAALGVTPADFAEKATEALGETVGPDAQLFIDADYGLGFMRDEAADRPGFFGSTYSIEGSSHRKDGLKRVMLNPLSEENYRKDDGRWYVSDHEGKKEYCIDTDTVLVEGLPTYDDGCDAPTWVQRYLDHPAFAESKNNQYDGSGFAPGDILMLLVDDNDRVKVIQSVSYWD